MDITPETINEILSDPSKLAMISSIVGRLSGKEASQAPESNAQVPVQNEITQEPDVPETAVPAIAEIVNIQPDIIKNASKLLPLLQGGIQNEKSNHLYEKRMGLLKAVRPFLNDDRKNRVDSLIKALGTAKTIEAFKGTDILSFLK